MKISRLFAPALIFLISYTIKVHRIEKGNFVIWDEAHFGKFSQKYLDREFYFDVHPPLGKMLTALSGFIYGQSKDFEFSSKENFPDKFDYQGMRRFHSLISSLTPLFGYLVLREFRISLRRSLLLSMLFLFENGVVFSGTWCFSVAAQDQADICVIYGSNGNISFPMFGNKITVTTDQTEEFMFEPLQHVQQPMIEKVVDYFLGKIENPCSGEDALITMKLMDDFTRK